MIDLGTGIINGLQLAVDDDEQQEKEDETNRRGIQSLTQSRLAAAFLQILRYDQIDTPTQVLFRLNLSDMKNTFDYRWVVL